jgi:hypothetical protein
VSTQVEGSEHRGWIVFAAVIMFAVGVLRIITAIDSFSSSHRIINLKHGLFGNQLWVWGIWDLVIAGLAFAVAVSILRGGRLGRVGGYIWGIVVIVQAFTMVSLAPTYATLSIVLGGLIIYALSRGEEAE